MDPRTLIGEWEEMASNHGGELKGHTVEVRVLDDAEAKHPPRRSWWEFRDAVSQIVGDRTTPGEHVFTAKDFYESQD
ncbi:MAG TPA: hypothetical protein VMI31_02745 [Fimbriimonadaceae bacterium]|nr:hypothetical protein [Fimbriimonadaceae bacterium]